MFFDVIKHSFKMKKFKISISLFALFLGAGLAFSGSNIVKANGRHVSPEWFAYNGSGSVTDAANYTEVGTEPDCPGFTSMCAIQAQVGTGNKPVITTSLRSEINTAIANHDPSGNVVLQDN